MSPAELAVRSAQGGNSFRVSSDVVTKTEGLRFDASFYNPKLLSAFDALEKSGMTLVNVADVVDRVFMPNRFKRNYVERAYGLPFLQGSHIVQYDPDDIKYLSLATHALEPVVIREGWILLTRSGTAGRVAIVPGQWDGWAASEHIFRLVPGSDPDCPTGYLATFLASSLGRVQLVAQIYGAVVDELTEEQVRRIRVPLPTNPRQREAVQEIDALAMQGVAERSGSVGLHREAASKMNSLLEVSGEAYRTPRSFSVNSERIAVTPKIRLDAGYFEERADEALNTLEATGMEISTVGELAERVFLPNRFKRYYVDSEHGVPFLRGANVVEFRPDDVMYLSNSVHQNLDALTIHEGWILITRSGTVGRVAVVSAEWEGWTATEDAIRIVSSSRCDSHYLGTFLASPLGKIQLTRQVFGAVVDHLTEDHVRSVKVPLPKTNLERERVGLVTRLAVEAAHLRAHAVRVFDRAEKELSQLVGVATPRSGRQPEGDSNAAGRSR